MDKQFYLKKLLENGNSCVIQAHGNSMYPTYKDGCFLIIQAGHIQYGDSVLVITEKLKARVHRIVCFEKNLIRLKGDGLSVYEHEWISHNDICGVIIGYKKRENLIYYKRENSIYNLLNKCIAHLSKWFAEVCTVTTKNFASRKQIMLLLIYLIRSTYKSSIIVINAVVNIFFTSKCKSK